MLKQVRSARPRASGQVFVIVASRYNAEYVNSMVRAAREELLQAGAKVRVVRVPGAFEIPLIAKKMAQSKKYDAVICLGAIIRGNTPHFEYIASEVAKGIALVNLETGVPVAFGVLTTDNIEQAIERAGTKEGNKGFEAAMNAIEMANLIKSIAGS